MDEAGADVAVPAAVDSWRRLSPWSIAHFAARAIIDNIRTLFFAAPATYGVARSDLSQYWWTIPIAIAGAVLIGAVLHYLFYSYRLRGDFVEVRQGALFRKHLNLAFARIQNINLEDPFYFRPLGLVTLKIDSAGSSRDEVHLAALTRAEAEALRTHIALRKRQLDGDERVLGETAESDAPRAAEVRFTRSVEDLVVHGLTNNRAYLVIAGIMGLLWQSNVSVGDLLGAVGIDFDELMRTSSAARLVVVFAISFVSIGAVLAMLSVAGAVIVYYGFTIYGSRDSLDVVRGLFTRHEIHVQKSRIQVAVIRQDWLDFLIGRRNVILEQVSHRAQTGDDWAQVRKKILIPSVRTHETTALLDEVLAVRRVDDLPFTALSKHYFHKRTAIWSGPYLLALTVLLSTSDPAWLYVPLVLLLWALHVAFLYMSWKRGGLAVDADLVVVRSGAIGIDYHVFPAFKIQEVRHVQSVLMRRRDVSTLVFRTAASAIRVPYLSTDFAKAVVDYCAYVVEAGDRSWM